MNYLKLFGGLCILMSSTNAAAQQKVFSNDEGIALGGYDVVAYFNQHAAIRGSKNHAVNNDGITYYFSSIENAAAFKEKPNSFIPAFGGHCAFAVAMGNGMVPSDPKTFKIRDGELYLFYNDYYEGAPFNTIVPWNGNEADNLAKARANWNKIK